MPNLSPIANLAVDDALPEDWVDDVADDLNFLTVAGADLASATTIVPTHEFHKVTGTTTIRNIDHAAEVAGQQLRLWFAGSLTIEHNGGGTGNIRLRTGVNRTTRPNEVLTLVFDGSTWREQDILANTIAFVQFTANVTFGSSVTDIVTSGSITYDGQPVEIEYYCPYLGSNGNATDTIYLYDGATDLGIMGRRYRSTTGGGANLTSSVVYLRTIYTPSAGAHELKIRAHTDSPSAVMTAGSGGAGAFRPAWMRVSRYRD